MIKFRNDSVKFADFFKKVYIWKSPDSPGKHYKMASQKRQFQHFSANNIRQLKYNLKTNFSNNL